MKNGKEYQSPIEPVDLNEKLFEWEKYYNLHKPHSAHAGYTPFEVLGLK